MGSHGYLGEGYRVVPRFLKGFGGAGQLVSALQKLVMDLGSPYLWGWWWPWSPPQVHGFGDSHGVPLSMGLAVAVGSLGVPGDNGGLPNSTGLVAAVTSRVTWP